MINKLCLVIYLTKWESQAAMGDLAHLFYLPDFPTRRDLECPFLQTLSFRHINANVS